MKVAPSYTLIETSKGDDPAIVVVNSALKSFVDIAAFPWHLRIEVACQQLAANGMPTAEEGRVLESLEASFEKQLLPKDNAVFLARTTCRGERVFLYRVHDPEVADSALRGLLSAESHLREWEYAMEHDPDWVLAQPELWLFEGGPRDI